MILLCYGTRPEWIKIKPLIDEMKAQSVPHKVYSQDSMWISVVVNMISN